MSSTLLTAGLACVIAAIVGGGLKAFGIEMPVVQSGKRQLALATLGIALLLGSLAGTAPPVKPAETRSREDALPSTVERINIDRQALASELQQNGAQIERLERSIAKHELHYAEQEPRLLLLENIITREGLNQDTSTEAKTVVDNGRSLIADLRRTDSENQRVIDRTKQRNSEIERLLSNS